MADTVPETVVYVSNAGSRDISVLAMNRNTGELTLIEQKEVPGSDKSPSSLPMAMAPNRRFIYAQLRGQPYPVSTFAIDHSNGKLTLVGTAPLVDQMAYLAVDRSGKHLLGASYVGAKVASYPIDARSGVSAKATQIIDTQPKTHCIFVDAANRHVYVPVLGADHIMQFRFDAASGMLTPSDPPVVDTKGAPARATSPSIQPASGVISYRDHGDDRHLCIDKDKGTLTEGRLRRYRRPQWQGLGLRLRYPRLPRRTFRLRRRAHHQHLAWLQDRSRQGDLDGDRKMANRKGTAWLRDRPAR
jgi:6-phosphogluconolactonase